MSGNPLTHSAASAGRYQSWAASHGGTVRTHNEDAFVNRPDLGLWGVADGAGGHDAGDYASRRIAETLGELPFDAGAADALAEVRQRIEAVHRELLAEAARRGDNAVIASTALVLLAYQAHFACLWAGDSRAYLLRDGVLTPISRDHSVVQELIEMGHISASEAGHHPHANVITRAVGAASDTFELEKRAGDLRSGDRLLLCTDGLSKTLHPATLRRILNSDEDSPAERMVLAALAAGASDNVTAVTIVVG